MIMTMEKLVDLVARFLDTDERRDKERFGAFFCRTIKACDPVVQREEDDGQALELIVKRWIKPGKRSGGTNNGTPKNTGRLREAGRERLLYG